MFLLFWPLMILSIILSVIALGRKAPFLLVIACLFIIPFSFYLAATSLFRWWGFILPLLYLGAALTLKKNRVWATVLLIAPVVSVIGWMGAVVVMQ